MPKKIIVVKQQDFKDCGVACLSSIIGFYGGYVPMETLRIDTHTDKDGTTAYDLVETAKKYGFDAGGYKMNETTILEKNIILPAIVHLKINNLDHFSVLYQINHRKVTLMDPAKGKKTISFDEFLKLWDGYIFVFYPKNKITVLTKQIKIIDLFRDLITKEKKLFNKIIITSFILTIFTIISSYYFKIAIENINNENYLKYIILIFAIIIIFKIIFYYLRAYYEAYLNKNINVYLMQDFLKHLFNLPSKVIQSRTSGEIMTRVNELNNLKNLFSDLFVSFFLDFVLTLITIPILYYISKSLLLILSFILLIYLLFGIFWSKIIYQRVMQNIEYEDGFNTTLLENITLFNSIKNLNKVKEVLFKVEKSLSNYLYDSFKFTKIVNKQNGFKNALNEISYYLVNTMGIILILNNKLSLINLVLFNSLMSFFFDPIKNLIDSLPKYNFLKASIAKISEFINIEEEKTDREEVMNHFDIVINNLNYHYHKFNETIKNFNLSIKEKEHLMIKGPSGSGKSTVCKLICKYETDYEGNILVGGINLKDYSLSTVRKNILYISQKEYLYSDTILNNILFYRDIKIDQFNEICKMCLIEEIVNKRPLRYDTFISMDSNNISGGERQRIILARALLNDFKILIIDEALSEVDIYKEKMIIDNIKKYYQDKTIIYISHKNIDNAFSKVIMMEGA